MAKYGNILVRDVTNLNVTLSVKYLTKADDGFQFHARKETVMREVQYNSISHLFISYNFKL